MPTTISKSRMFRLTVAVDDARLQAMKDAPDLARSALQTGAEYWHAKILPEHFKQGASAKYGYAPRASSYLKGRRKRGKPSLVFSGSLRHDLRAFAKYSPSGETVTLTMHARVLNFAPAMPQNSEDLYVKHKNGRGYPNLKRELIAMTDSDRAAVAEVVTRALEQGFDPQAFATRQVQEAIDAST